MKLFDVYPLYNINIVKGDGCKVWDENGTEYLDLYGGHAVISIGHAHPHYVDMISKQVATLGFYSNSVINKLQQQVAERLGKISGYEDYSLFLINSGAEANENALKLASFHNGRTKVISFGKAFHGRTSLAVEATDNPKIIAPINANGHITYLPLNDIEAAKAELAKEDICAVIIEGIQGVGGIKIPTPEFLQELRKACTEHGTILILDEIQSGYGRSGKFFAHQYAGIKPDIIIGCAGGGSNLGGLISPFMGEKLRGEADYHFIAVEPASCPSLTRGKYVYDFCDTGKVCPMAKMYTLGSGFIPSANHAGGLRYHGMSSIVSELYDQGLIEARSVEQTSVFEAAEQFARVEGILPAPESSHAIRVAIDEALKCKETGEEKTILFGLTGTGYFDMVAYEKYNNGEMSDYIPTDKDLEAGFAGLPKQPE